MAHPRDPSAVSCVMGRNAARAGREVLRFRLPLGTPLARRAPPSSTREQWAMCRPWGTGWAKVSLTGTGTVCYPFWGSLFSFLILYQRVSSDVSGILIHRSRISESISYLYRISYAAGVYQ